MKMSAKMVPWEMARYQPIFTLSFLVKMAKASIARGTETEYVNVEVVAGDAPPSAPAQAGRCHCGEGPVAQA